MEDIGEDLDALLCYSTYNLSCYNGEFFYPNDSSIPILVLVEKKFQEDIRYQMIHFKIITLEVATCFIVNYLMTVKQKMLLEPVTTECYYS